MQSTSFAVTTALSSTLQKWAIFALIFPVEEPVGATQQNVRLNAESGQLLDAVLGRLRLELARRADERHQGEVDVEDVVAPAVPAKLSDGLEERQALDCPRRCRRPRR